MKLTVAGISGFVITLVILLGVSVRVNVHNPTRFDPTPGIQLIVAGTQPLYAGSPNGAWGFVRGIAKFTKEITEAIDTMITQINSSGLTRVDSYTGTTGTYKIEWKGNTSVTITAAATGALLGTKTYTKSLRVADTTGTQLKLEIYYNADGDVLVRWMPYRTGTGFNNNSGLGECQVSGTAGSRTMYCSFYAPTTEFTTAASGPNWVRALIKVQESAGKYLFSAISDTKEAGYDPDGGGACGSGRYVFPLAFVANGTNPYQTVAKFGFNITDTVAQTVCGVANPYNYGLFSADSNPSSTGTDKYFVSEGTASGSIPAGYPTASEVDTVFGTVSSSTSASWGTGTVSLGNLQNLSLAFHNSASF